MLFAGHLDDDLNPAFIRHRRRKNLADSGGQGVLIRGERIQGWVILGKVLFMIAIEAGQPWGRAGRARGWDLLRTRRVGQRLIVRRPFSRR